jgi:L-lactate dehydrogenase complex protein LldG
MNARNHILDRLRAADVAPLNAPVLPQGVAVDDYGYHPEYWENLEKNLVAAHAEVIQAGPRHWRQHVAEVCQIKGIQRLLMPGQPPLPGAERQLPGPATWMTPWENGPELTVFDSPIENFKDVLFDDIDAGLTIAECAIADTGTLVLRSTPWQPRTLSLVPPIHICLLDARCLYPDLTSAMHIEGWQRDMPSNLIFVSGPSKTADIQQTLAYGAHGPKELIVILVAGEIR